MFADSKIPFANFATKQDIYNVFVDQNYVLKLIKNTTHLVRTILLVRLITTVTSPRIVCPNRNIRLHQIMTIIGEVVILLTTNPTPSLKHMECSN